MKIFVISAIIAVLAFATLSSSLTIRAIPGQAEFRKKNADLAEALQKKFATFTPDQDCVPDEIACVGKDFAKCAQVFKDGKLVNRFQLSPCNGAELECAVLPLVLKPGTSITCTTEADRLARLDQARKNL